MSISSRSSVLCDMSTSTTWGCELWDRHDAVVEETARDVSKLADYYARSADWRTKPGKLSRFMKERGQVEREYAKGVRRLVTRLVLLSI